MLFAHGQIIHGPTKPTDSLKVKILRHLQLNAIIGSGLNNTFMGYQRIKEHDRNGGKNSWEEHYQLFSNNEHLPISGIAEVGFNLKVRTKHLGLNHNIYFYSQVLSSQYHFTYRSQQWDSPDYEMIYITREADYTNKTLNLKFGYGFEFDFKCFYIIPQIIYCKEVFRKTTFTSYTDSSRYNQFHLNNIFLVSATHTEEKNKQYVTHSYYKYYVFSLEVGKNFDRRISRVYLRSGIGSIYTQKILSLGINVKLY
ncbi:MAG: hypothetical protein ACXVC7_13835 [Bacteroidia bacterium]